MIAHKLVISFWLIVLSLFLTPLTAFAQSSAPFAPSPTLPLTLSPLPSTVSPTSPLYTDLLVHNIFHTFSCLAVGQSVIGQPCLNYVKGVPVLSSVNLSGGALGATTSMIGMLFANPPVRTADYLASVGTSLGIVKEAHAQVVGSGANVLSPIINLWQVSRNISYIIMIVIFVVIGLMIIFRQRINPQTVITAQAALPGLVIGLILITFSYFLAGLISDTAFLGTNIVGYYFTAAQGKTSDPNWQEQLNLVQKISPVSVTSLFSDFVGIIHKDNATPALQAVYDRMNPEVQNAIKWFAGFLAFQTVGPLGAVAGPYAAIVGPVLGIVSGALTAILPTQILGLFLGYIAMFILIYAMIKLLFRLINSFLTIIFLTITAPFQFLFSSLPGRQGLVTEWIMNFLGNILAFPAVIAVFYFVAYILGPSHFQNIPDFPFKIAAASIPENREFVPSTYAQSGSIISRTATLPLLGGYDLDFIRILLAFGALVALPAIPDIVIRTIGKASQAGQLIGQEISGGTRSGQGYFQQQTGRITQTGQSVTTGAFGESYLTPTGERIINKPGILNMGRYRAFRKSGTAAK